MYYEGNSSNITTVEQNEQLEASDALYNKNVVRIQCNAQELKQEVREDNRMEMDHYVESHLEEDASEIMEKFNKILDADILRIRQEAALLIATEMDLHRDRIQSILRHS